MLNLMVICVLAARRSKGLIEYPAFWVVVGCIAVLVAVYIWGYRSRDEEVTGYKLQLDKWREDMKELKAEHEREIFVRMQAAYRSKLDEKEGQCMARIREYKKKMEECEKNASKKVRVCMGECKNRIKECEKIADESREARIKAEADKSMSERLLSEAVNSLRNDCLYFPSIEKRLQMLLENQDDVIAKLIRTKAPRAAEEVTKAKAQRRELFRECMLLRTRMEVYESLAPWLESYMECTLGEVLEAKAEEERLRQVECDTDVPERRYLTADEYSKLNEVERGQLALERYWNKSVKRNLWLVGIQYERYVGYLYEREGYEVVYHGALKGKEDLGVDLIAVKGKTAHVVQCKRYSELKRIPVRENSVAQIFGAAKVLQFENGYSRVVPVMITSYELSAEARRFAEALKVKIREHVALEPYPCIKCNEGKSGEKIYHLPFDQMYDRVKVEREKGEFYAGSVQEAYLAGFRRARKWSGG